MDHTSRPGKVEAVMVVRATRKLLNRVGPPATVQAASSATLGDWYATALFWRPQVALFVNERSLLPVLVPLAPAATLISRFPPCFAVTAAEIGVDPARIAQESSPWANTLWPGRPVGARSA